MRPSRHAHLFVTLLVCLLAGLTTPANAYTPAVHATSPAAVTAAAHRVAPAVVRVAHTATLSTLQAKIDWCRGPVFTKYRAYPGLIAEHDYCGGTYRLGRHAIGAQVRVTGPGVRNGLYRVVARKVVRKGSPFSVLNGMGHVVLQTCAGNSLRLVGMVRIGR
jgi:hypothetical protein